MSSDNISAPPSQDMALDLSTKSYTQLVSSSVTVAPALRCIRGNALRPRPRVAPYTRPRVTKTVRFEVDGVVSNPREGRGPACGCIALGERENRPPRVQAPEQNSQSTKHQVGLHPCTLQEDRLRVLDCLLGLRTTRAQQELTESRDPARLFSQRCPDLPTDPREWSREQVHSWLSYMQTTHSLAKIPHERFLMNGKALCLMSAAMFSQRVPVGGKLLYKDFRMRLCHAMALVSA